MNDNLKHNDKGDLSGDKELPIHEGNAGSGELRHHHIVHTIGTVADQQLPGLVPAYDDPDVAGRPGKRPGLPAGASAWEILVQ